MQLHGCFLDVLITLAHPTSLLHSTAYTYWPDVHVHYKQIWVCFSIFYRAQWSDEPNGGTAPQCSPEYPPGVGCHPWRKCNLHVPLKWMLSKSIWWVSVGILVWLLIRLWFDKPNFINERLQVTHNNLRSLPFYNNNFLIGQWNKSMEHPSGRTGCVCCKLLWFQLKLHW